MIFGLSIYFILMHFYVFSILGWIYEVIFVTIRDKKPANRGFLIGPMLPLYGIGATLVYIVLRPVAIYPSLLYLCGMFFATAIEYITAVLLEKLFHTKWWDYSKEPYNFQGRIAAIPSFFWGFLSLLLFDVLEPIASKIINAIPEKNGKYLLAILISITMVDLIYTLITTINFSKQLEALYSFRYEIENQLQDIRFSSIREAIIAKSPSLAEKWENISSKFALLKNSHENETLIMQLEERFKKYKEKHTLFIKKRPITGTKRIINAFPTMKFVSKNKSLVDVKEFINNLNIKTNKHKKSE